MADYTKNSLARSLFKLPVDSQLVLLSYLENKIEHFRFFSYGSNMNKEKFANDMQISATNLGLSISSKNKSKLELDPQAVKRTLLDFRRELSNESQKGRAFSIYPSENEKVEGICHDVDIFVLPAFLKKEGLLNRNQPSYKLITVHVLEEEQEVLTLIGLKPRPIKYLKGCQISRTLDYVSQSIKGAKDFNVYHEDMINVQTLLNKMRNSTQDN